MPALNLLLKSEVIEQVPKHQHLGVVIDDQLKWQAHNNYTTNAVTKNVSLLSRLRHVFNAEACRTFLNGHILSRINYVSNVWNDCSDMYVKKLKSVRKRAVKDLRAASRM